MKVFIFVLVIAAVVWTIHRSRSRALRRAALRYGLTVSDAPLLDEREAWIELSRIVHDHVPTTWGFCLQGTVDDIELGIQEQEVRPQLGDNRRWHTLVVWTFPTDTMPAFRFGRNRQDIPRLTWLSEDRRHRLIDCRSEGPLASDGRHLVWFVRGRVTGQGLYDLVQRARTLKDILVNNHD